MRLIIHYANKIAQIAFVQIYIHIHDYICCNNISFNDLQLDVYTKLNELFVAKYFLMINAIIFPTRLSAGQIDDSRNKRVSLSADLNFTTIPR